MRVTFALVFAVVACAGYPAGAQTPSVSFMPPTQPQGQATPRWARIAFFDPSRVAGESSFGKSASMTLETLRRKRAVEADAKNKALRAEQQKLETGSAVMSDAARAELAKKIDKFQIDVQRFLEDARAELLSTEQRLSDQLRRMLVPALDRVAKQRGLDLIFSRADSGLVWGDPKFDISDDLVKELDRGDPPK